MFTRWSLTFSGRQVAYSRFIRRGFHTGEAIFLKSFRHFSLVDARKLGSSLLISSHGVTALSPTMNVMLCQVAFRFLFSNCNPGGRDIEKREDNNDLPRHVSTAGKLDLLAHPPALLFCCLFFGKLLHTCQANFDLIFMKFVSLGFPQCLAKRFARLP